MYKRTFDIVQGVLSFVFVVSIPFIAYYGTSYLWGTKCADVPIEFTVVRENSTLFVKGTEEISQEGVNGVKEVCTYNRGGIAGETVKRTPTNQIILIGTSEPAPYVPPRRVEYNSGGAICTDGTRSYSTGRGTCSWHGGVAEWL